MSTEKRRSFIINFTYLAILVLIFIVLAQYVLPLLTPFILGFIVAYILQKPIRFVQKKTNLPYKPLSLLMVTVFYATIGVLIVLLGIRLFYTIETMLSGLPLFYVRTIMPILNDMFIRLEALALAMDETLFTQITTLATQVMGSVSDLVHQMSVGAVSVVSGAAVSLPGIFFRTLLMIISTFFFAADYDHLTGFCCYQLDKASNGLFTQVKNYLVDTLFVCIRSYAIIMFITFVELALGLSVIGINSAVLIAALISVFDILPVLGTGGIMLPWAAIAILSGRYGLGIGLTVLYLVVTIIRNIIEPKIVGGQLGLHPVVTLASMFAGLELFGLVGLFGFPILLSLLCYLNDNKTIRILHPYPPKERQAEESLQFPIEI